MFDFSIVTQWVHSLLTSFMPEELAVLIECIVIGVCIMLAYAVIAIIMIFMERKVCAAFQCRLGPMRVGPQGTIQVLSLIHISEPTRQAEISYAVFCLKKKKQQ